MHADVRDPHLPQADKLPLLQVLRALAASMVVLAHAWDNYLVKVDPQASLPLTFDFGLFGVQIFFCISGFILAQSAASLPRGLASFQQFFLKRLIRIVPLYWAATLLYAAKLHWQGVGPSGAAVVASLLFWPFAEPGTALMRPVLGVGWTLNFEMLFYSLLSLALVLAPRWRLWAVGSVLLALSLSRHLGWVTLGPEGASALYLWADDILLFFLLGTVAAHLVAWAQRVQWPPLSLTWATVLLLACLLGYVAAQSMGAWQQGSPLWVAMPTCLVLIWLSVAHHGALPGRWAQGLQRCLVAAGDGSYSTYLIHGFLLGIMTRMVSAAGLSVSIGVFSLAALLICNIAGVLSYWWFEVPVTRWLKARVFKGQLPR